MDEHADCRGVVTGNWKDSHQREGCWEQFNEKSKNCKDNITQFGVWMDSLIYPIWRLAVDKDAACAMLMVSLRCIYNVMVFDNRKPNPNDILYSIKVS